MREFDVIQCFTTLITSHVRVRGFYYQHTGKLLQSAQGLTREVRDLYAKAASEYIETLKYYPQDDQYNTCKSMTTTAVAEKPHHKQ